MKRISIVFLYVLMSILLAACANLPDLTDLPQPQATSPALAEETVPRYEVLEECFTELPEDVDYECGLVTVPEFHGVDNGRTIELAVLRFPSTGGTPGDPVFVGAGGPGQSAIPQGVMTAYSLQFGSGVLPEVLATRDLVYFSQRGTAFSTPDLACLDARRPQWALPNDGDAHDETSSSEASATSTVEVTFVCPNGTAIDAVFDNAAKTVIITLADETLTLLQVESGSGARYSDGTTTFWNKGGRGIGRG